MVAKIIDGKAVAQHVRQECKLETQALKDQGVTPGLAVIIVGDNPASKVYVANKVKACTEVGLDSTVYAFDADTPDQVVPSETSARGDCRRETTGIPCKAGSDGVPLCLWPGRQGSWKATAARCSHRK